MKLRIPSPPEALAHCVPGERIMREGVCSTGMEEKQKTVAWGGGGGICILCVDLAGMGLYLPTDQLQGNPFVDNERPASIQGAEHLNLQQTRALNKR